MTRTISLERDPSLPVIFARAVASGRGRHGGPLPDLQVEQRGVLIEGERLASYDHVCGFTLRDTVPSTYLHVLTFPLQVRLFAEPSYPYALAGSVHVANTITQHRAVRTDEVLDLRVRLGGARPHRRGVVVDVLGQVRAGDELVWEGVSSYLYRGAKAPDQIGSGESPEGSPGIAQNAQPIDTERNDTERNETEPIDGPGAIWALPSDLGRRYAAVSGDVNPIHLHPLTAKAMGFPAAIAHGMWTTARMLSDVENRLPDAYVAHVEFRKPVLLPSRVRFVARPTEGAGFDLALRSARGDDVHAFGRVGPVSVTAGHSIS